MAEADSILTAAVQARSSTLTGAELHARLGELRLTIGDLQALVDRLEALIEPGALEEAQLGEIVARLAPLAAWVFTDVAKDGADAAVRLRTLVRAVNLVGPWGARLSGAVRRVVAEVDFEPMFELGLPNDRGLYEETMDRLARGLLPRPRDPHGGRELLAALVPHRDAAIWLASITPELAGLLASLTDEPGLHERLRRALDDTIAIIATRVSAIGLGRELRERSPARALAASPFYLLPRLCDALFSGVGSSASCFEQISAARADLRGVLSHLDQFGVSLDVVYRIEVIEQNLDRLVELLMVRDADAAAAALPLVGRLAVAQIQSRSLREVVRTNGRLLARKVVERAGTSGEHYITSSRAEWRAMFLAGAGGGIVTVGTTALKFAIVLAHLPLFLDGLAASLNYAASFLLMQLCSFSLATKQPSMVAASLAGSIKSARHDVDLSELVDLIARICRSQFAAVVGNVVLGFWGGVLFEMAWSAIYGTPFLTPAKAQATLRSFDPIHSGTILFAAVTGVFLWLSSIGAGWLENFTVYRRVFEGIAQHPAGRWIGQARLAGIAEQLKHGMSGIGGNISIGFLLGMTPALGVFFGVPLEVRHVTLSTVSLGMALAPHGLMGLVHSGAGSAIVGIVAILICNFGVSFALALWVAMRARGVRNQGARLVAALWQRFYATPLDFFRPPRDTP